MTTDSTQQGDGVVDAAVAVVEQQQEEGKQEDKRQHQAREHQQERQQQERKPSARELAMESIVEQRNKQFLADEGLSQKEGQKEEEEDGRAALDLIAQVGKQLEGGVVLLDEGTLARAVIKQKIDGVEELVPAEKVFRQYQKSAAADLRLAEATRLQKEAQEALEEARSKARVAKEQAASDETKAKAEVDLDATGKALIAAMYTGDEERSGKMLAEYVKSAVDSALAGRANATPQVDDLVNRAVQAAIPVMKQQLSVQGALDRLQQDYPDIWNDPDLARVTDWHVGELEAEGKSRPVAISEAAERVAKKFKLGKFAERPAADPATTMQSERLAKKAALDEPKAASARAGDSAPAPQTTSQVIEEMRKLRAGAVT